MEKRAYSRENEREYLNRLEGNLTNGRKNEIDRMASKKNSIFTSPDLRLRNLEEARTRGFDDATMLSKLSIYKNIGDKDNPFFIKLSSLLDETTYTVKKEREGSVNECCGLFIEMPDASAFNNDIKRLGYSDAEYVFAEIDRFGHIKNNRAYPIDAYFLQEHFMTETERKMTSPERYPVNTEELEGTEFENMRPDNVSLLLQAIMVAQKQEHQVNIMHTFWHLVRDMNKDGRPELIVTKYMTNKKCPKHNQRDDGYREFDRNIKPEEKGEIPTGEKTYDDSRDDYER